MLKLLLLCSGYSPCFGRLAHVLRKLKRISVSIHNAATPFKLFGSPMVNLTGIDRHFRGEPMDNYHIKKTEKLWELVKEGAQRASKTASTKAEITEIASEFLQGKTASLKIHKEDGTIQEERTFPRSADPRKTKG